MKLIIGLGNPGPEYDGTRHNIGFQVLNHLADRLEIRLEKEKFEANYGSGHIGDESVLLVKPQTYMNLSGIAVRRFTEFWKVPTEEVLVLHDDVDFSLGTMRLVYGAGPAGHNGVTSLIAELGSKDFYRLRLGVGRPLKGDVVNFVLTRFEPEQQDEVLEIVKKAAEASQVWVTEGPEVAKRRLK